MYQWQCLLIFIQRRHHSNVQAAEQMHLCLADFRRPSFTEHLKVSLSPPVRMCMLQSGCMLVQNRCQNQYEIKTQHYRSRQAGSVIPSVQSPEMCRYLCALRGEGIIFSVEFQLSKLQVWIGPYHTVGTTTIDHATLFVHSKGAYLRSNHTRCIWFAIFLQRSNSSFSATNGIPT